MEQMPYPCGDLPLRAPHGLRLFPRVSHHSQPIAWHSLHVRAIALSEFRLQITLLALHHSKCRIKAAGTTRTSIQSDPSAIPIPVSSRIKAKYIGFRVHANIPVDRR
jgi:hypothetical protein